MVIFKFYSPNDSLLYARNNTRRGLKKFWSKDFPFYSYTTDILYYKYNYFDSSNFIIWNGTVDEYLIFKLSEPENRIITQFDLDIDKVNHIRLLAKESSKLYKNYKHNGYITNKNRDEVNKSIRELFNFENKYIKE